MIAGISEKAENLIIDALNEKGVIGQPRHVLENNYFRVSIDKNEADYLQQAGINLGDLAVQLSSEMGIPVTYSTKSVTKKGTIHNLDFESGALHLKLAPPPAPQPKITKDQSTDDIDKLSAMLQKNIQFKPKPTNPAQQTIKDNITRLINEGALKWQGESLNLRGKFNIKFGDNYVFVHFAKGSLNQRQLALIFKHCRETIKMGFHDNAMGMKSSKCDGPFLRLNKRNCEQFLGKELKPVTYAYRKTIVQARRPAHHSAIAAGRRPKTRYTPH